MPICLDRWIDGARVSTFRIVEPFVRLSLAKLFFCVFLFLRYISPSFTFHICFHYSIVVTKYLTGNSHHCVQGFRPITSHRDLPQVLTVSLSCDSTGWAYPVIARPFCPRRTCSKRRIFTARRRIITRQCSPYSWRSSDKESAICNSPSPRSSQKLLTRGTERWRTFRRVAKCWRVEW